MGALMTPLGHLAGAIQDRHGAGFIALALLGALMAGLLTLLRCRQHAIAPSALAMAGGGAAVIAAALAGFDGVSAAHVFDAVLTWGASCFAAGIAVGLFLVWGVRRARRLTTAFAAPVGRRPMHPAWHIARQLFFVSLALRLAMRSGALRAPPISARIILT